MSEEAEGVRDETWLEIAPVYTRFPTEAGLLDEPFSFGDGLTFQKLPKWFAENSIPDWLAFMEKDRLRHADVCFVAARPAGPGGPGQEASEEDAGKIHLARFSIWLVTGLRLHYDHIIRVEPPRGGTVGTHAGWRRLSWTSPLLFPCKTLLTRVHLEEARALQSVFSLGLRQEGALWTATRMANLASAEFQGDVAFLLYWVGLEALFAPDDAGETVYKTSLSIAHFLEPDRKKARLLFDRVKASYGLRSKVVHGRRAGLASKKEPEKMKEAIALFKETATWLRTALRRIALSEELRARFSAKKERERYLQDLHFGV